MLMHESYLKLSKKNSQRTWGLADLYHLGEPDTLFDLTAVEKKQVEDSYRRLMDEALADSSNRIYGLHTYYGENVRNSVDPNDWRQTQSGLLEYLQVGVGAPLPDKVVRRALRLQAIKTAHGLSGIHPTTVEKLIALAAGHQLPKVPRKGSLGASGDLVSMAHAIDPVFREGVPGPRDVIGLVNTNSMMSAFAIEQFYKLEEVLDKTVETVAMNSIAMGIGEEHFSQRGLGVGGVHKTYARAGQRLISTRNRFIESGVVEGKGSLHQARYSLRCAPQIIGHCLDMMEFAEKKILSEAVAVADNPLILEDGQPWHGGLFYAIGIAAAADALTEVVHRLSEMLDRQTLLLMDNNLNGGLPDNLNVSGFGHCKGIHQMISALHQEVKALSLPSRSLSFSCEGNNQDLVPCGMTALNKLDLLINTFFDVLRGARFCSHRAGELCKGKHLPPTLHISELSRYQISGELI